MNADPIPPDVRDFVQRHIETIAEVEALLLLRGNASARWTVATLAARLYISEQVADQVLARLEALGATAREGGFSRYCCATPELDAAVGRLAQAYSSYLIPVTNLIHAKSGSRIREFADAFQFIKGR